LGRGNRKPGKANVSPCAKRQYHKEGGPAKLTVNIWYGEEENKGVCSLGGRIWVVGKGSVPPRKGVRQKQRKEGDFKLAEECGGVKNSLRIRLNLNSERGG